GEGQHQDDEIAGTGTDYRVASAALYEPSETLFHAKGWRKPSSEGMASQRVRAVRLSGGTKTPNDACQVTAHRPLGRREWHRAFHKLVRALERYIRANIVTDREHQHRHARCTARSTVPLSRARPKW